MNQVLETILNILIIIVMLSVLIAIHEAGHLAMAKAFKVYCFDYSIGFGPAFLHKKRKNGETYFSLRAIPFGGFVSMYGEPGAVPPGETEPPEERSLLRVAKWKKCIILGAGVTLNFILGLVLLFISDSCFPQYYYAYGGVNSSYMGVVYESATYSGQSLSYIESVLSKDYDVKNVNMSLLYGGEGLLMVDPCVKVKDASGETKGEYVACITTSDASSNKELEEVLALYEFNTEKVANYTYVGAGVKQLPAANKKVTLDSSFNGCTFELSPYFTYYVEGGKEGFAYNFQYNTVRPNNKISVSVTSGQLSSIGVKLGKLHTDGENAFAVSSVSQLNFHRPTFSGEAKTKMDAILPSGTQASDYVMGFYTAGSNVSVLDDEVYLYKADGTLYLEKRYVALYYSTETAIDHSLASSIRLYPASKEIVPVTERKHMDVYPDVSDSDNYLRFDATTEGVYFDLNLRFIHLPSEGDRSKFYENYLNDSFTTTNQIRMVSKNGSLVDDGITIPVISSYRSFSEAWKQWSEDVPYCCSAIVKGFASLFTKEGIQNVSGIVGMTAALPTIKAAGGVGSVFFYAALISINLAFFNLLPFPGLDGYQIVLTIIEGITKKQVPPKIGGIISFVGLALLILFMVFITVKDIIGLF